jgi:hypothetical protein
VVTHVSLHGDYTAATLLEEIEKHNWATFNPAVATIPLNGEYQLHELVNLLQTTAWRVPPTAPPTAAKRKRASQIASPEDGQELKHNRPDKDDPSGDEGSAPNQGPPLGPPGGPGGGGQGLSV